MYFEEVDAVANASINFRSNSEEFLEYFDNNCVRPSITISCDASFEISEIKIDNADVKSSRFLMEEIRETSKSFPPRSIPSSISSLMFTNRVSGSRDQIPGFDI